MECLRKNRAEWKSTKKYPKNYFLKTFPKNILFFGQNYPKICTKKDFKKNWLVTYTLGWICSGRSVIYPSLCRKGWVKISWTSEFRWWAVKKTTNVEITCLKMQMIGLEKYRNSFGRNPALLQKKHWYHLSANADGWVWQMQSGQTSKSRYLQCANTNAWFWQIHEGPPCWCHLCDMANAYMLERSFIQIITHIAKMWWCIGGVLGQPFLLMISLIISIKSMMLDNK